MLYAKPLCTTNFKPSSSFPNTALHNHYVNRTTALSQTHNDQQKTHEP